MKKVFLIALATLSTLAVAEPPATIDIKNLPGGAKVVDDVIIPVPSEIFNVLDRVGVPHWKDVLRPTKGIQTPGEREQIALLLGTVIAEGFIAVEAKNAEEVKAIGRLVIQLSTTLNVQNSVKKRASAIIDSADKQDWMNVRKELDKAQHDVQDAMRAMGDEQTLAQLVSLGGWLRGTEALAAVINQDYEKYTADLLHQPSLVSNFERRLNNMPAKIKDKALVKKMLKGIVEIRPLLGQEGSQITAKTVKDIEAIVQDLVKSITAKSLN